MRRPLSILHVAPFGKFGWAYDGDGNKIELWQPTTSGKAPRAPKARG